MDRSRQSRTRAEVQAELRPGQSPELLQALHLLTREGALNADSRRKLKQVDHLITQIELRLKDRLGDQKPLQFADLGAGKHYLGLLLADLWLRNRPDSKLFGVESRPELCARVSEIAREVGLTGVEPVSASISQALTDPRLPERLDVVTALHACDTATDDAIDFGLAKKAQWLFLVPCCQAEMATQLGSLGPAHATAAVWREPIHRREFGSLLTNVFRVHRLEAHGYRVTTTELVGWEHSLKNELLIAERMGEEGTPAARARWEALLAQYPLKGRFRGA